MLWLTTFCRPFRAHLFLSEYLQTEEFLQKLHEGNCAAVSSTPQPMLFNGSSSSSSQMSPSSSVADTDSAFESSVASSSSGATYLVDVRKLTSSSSFSSETQGSRTPNSNKLSFFPSLSDVIDWAVNEREDDDNERVASAPSSAEQFDARAFFEFSSDDELESTRL
jgi:hypothetical protein